MSQTPTEFAPTDPDSPTSAFVSLTGKIHLGGPSASWGPAPRCTTKYTRGEVTTVPRKEITCLNCQQILLDEN